MGERITQYGYETWTWFPDGDETRAMTRVTITTDVYGDFHGSKTSYILDVIQGAHEYIDGIEPASVDLTGVTYYGKSAFSQWIHFTYERPATETEVNHTRILRDQQREERRERLLKELEELDAEG